MDSASAAHSARPDPKVHASTAGPDEPDLYKSAVQEPDSPVWWWAFPAVARLEPPAWQVSPVARPCPASAAQSDAQPAARQDSVSLEDAAAHPLLQDQEPPPVPVRRAGPGALPAAA
jgi:hypothetical protein